MQSTISAAGATLGLEALLADLNATSDAGAQEASAQSDIGNQDAGDTSDVGTVILAEGGSDSDGERETEPVDKKALAAAMREAKKKQAEEAKQKKKQDAAAARAAKQAEKAAAKAAQAVVPQDETSTPAAPTEAKPAPEKVVYFGRNKLGRLEHRLGENADNAMLYELTDLELEGDARQAKIAENKTAFKSLAVKVQNRATNVIEFVTGKANRLNPVIEITIRLLAKDRKLESGEKGNLSLRLSQLYTPGSASAMGNSTLGMLRALNIITEKAKQHYVPNEGSTLLAQISKMLSLSFIDVDAEVAAEEERDAAEHAQRAIDNAANLATVDTPVDPAPEAASTVEAATGPIDDMEALLGDLNAATVEEGEAVAA